MLRCIQIVSQCLFFQFPLPRTRFDSSISVRRSFGDNGSNEDPKVKFTCIVLSNNHKAWKGTREEVRTKAVTRLINFTSSSQLSPP